MRTKTPKIKALRCVKGLTLLRSWVSAYNQNVKTKPNADMSWQDVFGRGYLKYAKHASTCPSCGAFEQARFARYK